MRVLRETEFMTELSRRINDEYWRKVEVIQTCVKAKTGCGESILIHFLAPLDQEQSEREIDYDYKSMATDHELLSRGDDRQFAYKQCLKMCYYIQKVHGYEILQMKAEFFKDEWKVIWFFYARDIYGRPCSSRDVLSSIDAKKQAKKIQSNKEALRQQMISDLDEFEGQLKSQKSTAVQKMLGMMNGYYTNLKNEVGIEDQAGIDDEDYELDDILRTLKPNTTAANFKEFL